MLIQKIVSLTVRTSVTAIILVQAVYANLPVIDFTNLLESVTQTSQQLQQYKTQLSQYENMLENTKNLDKFTWDEATNTMDNLVNSIDTLNYYKQQAGGMNEYLSRYQDENHYRNMPCFNGRQCSEAELNALAQQEANASEAQKRANDAMLRGIEQQEIAMKSDARQLTRLQEQAQGASGQMAALQAANQLASAETNQLLQIRGLMVAAQNAEATRLAAIADKEAIQAAGDERFRQGSFKKSSGKTW
ncbi:P-type conjugative transfer protein TrbJ (plasmid) [Legionella pneumophila]